MPLSDEQWRDLVLSVGTGRSVRRLPPSHVSKLLAEAVTYLSREEIARRLGLKGTDMIARFLALRRLPEDDLGLVCWRREEGLVPFTSAYFASKLQDSASRSALLRAIITNRLDTTEVESVVQLMERSHVTLPESINKVVKSRRQVTTQHLFAGVITSLPSGLQGVDEQGLSAQLKKAVTLGVPGISVIAAKISGDRYFIVTNSKGADAMKDSWTRRGLDMDSFVSELLRAIT